MKEECCDYCGKSFKRPSFESCKQKHVQPTLEQKIVEKIERDICDRGGLQEAFEGIDEETQQEIRDTWAKIISANLN
jgi:hypothetical protein